MYLKFFGLFEKPFNTMPDPRFLYLSPSHRRCGGRGEHLESRRRRMPNRVVSRASSFRGDSGCRSTAMYCASCGRHASAAIRATTGKNEFAQGVHSSRITILSYGEERPLCTTENEHCWRQNRRSRFLVKPR